ncbi:ABC transporter permease [Leifsonia sp. Leaf264]|uniref:ABC transporter permease n=1 Tax=Leifsonia sp. Leaf264 TaxID=1736314 RepID=UPI0006FE218E|nr:hypothetical protein [Leifsonia sp. Leaf264]KQP01634.1 hypothetical protein ASF30_03345 [Leifsonia sp. Leaf264]
MSAPSASLGTIRGTWLIATVELRQRVRGVAWYVLLGIFMLIVLCVTVLLVIATNAWSDGGGGTFSTIILFVLLLGTLVSPALSGNAINGEREGGTLATTQVTLVTTWQIVLGKWIAAWITALAFLLGALPFLVFAVALGKVSALTIAVSTMVLAFELGVVAAIGVGLSGVITRPLFSIVVTYLVIAFLSVGTLIAFGLAGAATQSTVAVTTTGYPESAWDPQTGELAPGATCTEVTSYEYQIPRFDHYWGILAANPYVILADASPAAFSSVGAPEDLFTWISVAVRGAQQTPELVDEYNDCLQSQQPAQTAEQIYAESVPSWFVGAIIHVVIASGALVWAWRRTDTPAKRLPKGMRVA